MIDLVSELVRRKEHYISLKKDIMRNAEEQCKEINIEIQNIDKAVSLINDAITPFICPRCKGTGEVRKCDAAGQMESVKCTYCKGTGIKGEY